MSRKRFIKLIAVSAVTAVFMMFFACAAYAQNYYVDGVNGSNSNSGTADKPFSTIQYAADKVRAGDTVIIRPVIYYEHIVLDNTGTKDKPIIFKAEEYGRDKIVISGADRNIAEHKVKWDLEDESIGLYSIDFDYPIYRMTANDVQVVEYLSLRGLKTNIYNATDPSDSMPEGSEGYAPGYEHGFFYDKINKKLYVRLGNDGCIASDNPNDNAVTINVSATPTSDNGKWRDGKEYSGQGQAGITGKESFLFGVTSEASSNVVISGITFKMPAVAAVWARCNDLTVSNCWFIGCIEGVRGGCCATSDPTFVSENITIEHCYYTNYPIYTDAMKILIKYANDTKARCIDTDENGKIITDSNGNIPNVTVAKVLYFWQAKNGMTCNYEGGGLACYMGEKQNI
jgi:hypothetical protein